MPFTIPKLCTLQCKQKSTDCQINEIEKLKVLFYSLRPYEKGYISNFRAMSTLSDLGKYFKCWFPVDKLASFFLSMISTC